MFRLNWRVCSKIEKVAVNDALPLKAAGRSRL